MFGLTDQLFEWLWMFGFSMLMAIGVWIILDPATFWQTLTTLVVSVIVYVGSFVAIYLFFIEFGG